MNDELIKFSDFPNREPSLQATELVWYALSVIQALLIFRFILKLFGADSTENFTSMLYGVTNYIVSPFTAVFGPSTSSVNVFDWPALVAIIAYWILAAGVIKLFKNNSSSYSRIERARALSIKKYSSLRTDNF